MVIKLQRLTTEYIVIEDRIRISGETRDSGPVVMWLTNRLAMRAVPQLLRWLEDQAAPTTGSSSDSPGLKRELQSFAQATFFCRSRSSPSCTAIGTPPLQPPFGTQIPERKYDRSLAHEASICNG